MTVADISSRSQKVILYHGSKSGIRGPVAPISREHCDFGKGFYLGESLFQSASFVSSNKDSSIYIFKYKGDKICFHTEFEVIIYIQSDKVKQIM